MLWVRTGLFALVALRTFSGLLAAFDLRVHTGASIQLPVGVELGDGGGEGGGARVAMSRRFRSLGRAARQTLCPRPPSNGLVDSGVDRSEELADRVPRMGGTAVRPGVVRGRTRVGGLRDLWLGVGVSERGGRRV